MIKKILEPAFTAFGIKVRFHHTFFLLYVGLIIFSIIFEDAYSTLKLLFYIITIFTFVTIHELAHSLVAKHYGIPTLEILLTFIGGIAKVDYEEPFEHEGKVAIAGPLTNVFFCILFFSLFSVCNSYYGEDVLITKVFLKLTTFNAYIGGFNLFPIYPLDGGRILRVLLRLKFDFRIATYTVLISGIIMASVMMTLAILKGHHTLIVISGFIIGIDVLEYLGKRLKDKRDRERDQIERRRLEHLPKELEVESILAKWKKNGAPKEIENEWKYLMQERKENE